MSDNQDGRRARAAYRAGDFPPPPEPLPVPVLDSHTHLDIMLAERGHNGPSSVPEAVATAHAVGVDRLVQAGVDVESSKWSANLADAEPAVLATVALHPNEAPRLADLDAALHEIERLAAAGRVRAVGETGLDYFRTGESGRKAQHESFRAHIAMAKRYG